MSSKKIVQLALTLSQAVVGLASTLSITTECTASTFTFPVDQLFGTSSLGIIAAPVFNYTAVSVSPGTTVGGSYTVNFCNVTVTYTHPGWNDTIHATVWLPTQDKWNGRLQALGGGGYSASFGALYTTQAVAKGYVAIGTDAGHVAGDAASLTPNTWALTSPGNVNLYLLEDWGSRSLHEMAVIGKAVTEAFYGTEPVYSYFSGCSGGGRQALEIAQKYPEDFDGIIAAAPAINIESYWAAQVMRDLSTYPPACEIDAFTKAAIQVCDDLDGLQDGIIALPGATRQFTSAGATVVQAAWTGPRSQDGKTGWFGLNKDASLTSYYAATTCTSNLTCSAAPLGLFSSWITYFSAKNPDFDLGNMTDAQFFSYLTQSQDEYHSLVAAANPDLSGFRAAGGKMISWQGLADEAIPPNGTVAYFQQAPGVGHCQTTVGPNPNGAFDQLVAWVENAVVPETLTAVDTSGNTRNLCAWPLQQIYMGGNSSDPDSFNCTLATYPSFTADYPFYDSF
ncbi:hypothetical protein BP5796_10323 [Coleophoma crateriformis]|uniref:Carboxylic ester hydrolase n=1 Tax=Coleophoma crateriformis TaxID=565419 RepID=A0A3D8QQ27_9HELO|nr:hypothetical protein BP5796_10323 [Coleophoma crateriformis]